MHHGQGGGGRELDGEVAVAHRVERIGGHTLETELPGGEGPVDGEGRARQGGGAERHLIDSAAAVQEAVAVTQQHLEPSQQVMAKTDGLRRLQMGVARHDRFAVALREIEQGACQGVFQGQQRIDFVAQVQAQVSGDLVVARAGGVQLLAGLADQLDQPVLDVHVDVFEAGAPLEVAGIDLALDLPKSLLDPLGFGAGQHADVRQHAAMGDRAADVVAVKPLVEGHRGGEHLDELVGVFENAALKQLGPSALGWMVHG